jgi:3-oxoacyl-[acyl-carrier protein] reductase
VVEYAPLKRIATPEDIAGAILFLAGPTGRNITGAALQTDGGATAGHSSGV